MPDAFRRYLDGSMAEGVAWKLALLTVLEAHGVPLRSELDEQGLQVVALDLGREAHVVSTDEVTI